MFRAIFITVGPKCDYSRGKEEQLCSWTLDNGLLLLLGNYFHWMTNQLSALETLYCWGESRCQRCHTKNNKPTTFFLWMRIRCSVQRVRMIAIALMEPVPHRWASAAIQSTVEFFLWTWHGQQPKSSTPLCSGMIILCTVLVAVIYNPNFTHV